MLGRNLLRNLSAGARLVFFRPIGVADFRISPADFAVLFTLNVLVWIAAAAIRIGADGDLNLSALPGMMLQVPLVLFAALLVGAIYRRSDLLLALAVMWIAGDWVFEVMMIAIHYFFMAGQPSVLPRRFAPTIGNIYTLWGLVVLWRAVWIAAGRKRPQSIYAAGLMTAFYGFVFFFVPRGEPWVESPAEVAAEPSGLTAGHEEVFHLQPTILAETLAAVQPGRPGEIDLFFVGMAGYAPQNVFLNEVTAVEKLFAERFGTKGRAVTMINSATTLREAPIATMTNLRATLTDLSRAMNRDEDVLFLFLTSHGDREHRLAFELPPLSLQQPTPPALARMLVESRIKWKVIVISACFSGGFVEPLADANTLIITASAADKSSFGCEHGRDWTYFGEAYFRDALAKTGSFTEAFAIASAAIAEREKREDLEPSEPQMNIGAAMRERLPAIEAAITKGRTGGKSEGK